jgi:hypothetical protein
MALLRAPTFSLGQYQLFSHFKTNTFCSHGGGGIDVKICEYEQGRGGIYPEAYERVRLLIYLNYLLVTVASVRMIVCCV